MPDKHPFSNKLKSHGPIMLGSAKEANNVIAFQISLMQRALICTSQLYHRAIDNKQAETTEPVLVAQFCSMEPAPVSVYILIMKVLQVVVHAKSTNFSCSEDLVFNIQ